ncbi:MAG: glycosyltransferase family 2 protein [Bacteroidetes bacterium]|nr:glycosyltransferase family 2 protein [Bacteroidota bacterium]
MNISTGEEKNPSVAIVILNWNGKNYLEKFLPAVCASTYSNKRIIVADNASTDDSVKCIQEKFPSVEIIVNGANFGFAKGYNEALKKVSADYYVLLNSDVEVTATWIEPVIQLMESDKMIGACQPKILSYSDKSMFEYAGACGGWIDNFGYPFARGRVFNDCEKDNGQYNDVQECLWASGAALFVRAEVYQSLGGLDEYFFAHQEEIDLCWRMQRTGFKVYAQPASVVYHVGGGTLPKGNNRKTFLNFRNNLVMLYKNLPLGQVLWTIPARIILDAIAAWKELLNGDTGYFFAVLKAHVRFTGWLVSGKKAGTPLPTTSKKITGKYQGCIVWDYFIKKKKTFAEIIGYK